MGTVASHLEKFFKDNHQHLESNYPGIRLEKLILFFEEKFQVSKEDHFFSSHAQILESMMDGTPLEYLSGSKFFYRSSFYVDERVLIPRNETEILVEEASKFIDKVEADVVKVSEVGVGSFALGLSLLMECKKRIEFTGGDISREALEVAKINLFRHKNVISSQNKIELVESDRFEKIEAGLDLIVSNPPYIKRSQGNLVHKNVLSFEPDVSLFLEDTNHDEWFRKFFLDGAQRLKSGGALMMEGHEDNLEALSDMANEYFSKVLIKNDYTGSRRFLLCFKEN